jgi:hypothetical protein
MERRRGREADLKRDAKTLAAGKDSKERNVRVRSEIGFVGIYSPFFP